MELPRLGSNLTVFLLPEPQPAEMTGLHSHAQPYSGHV